MKFLILKYKIYLKKRYEARIKNIVSKAKDEVMKANEIAFIMMLENNNKKLTLDEKLKDI